MLKRRFSIERVNINWRLNDILIYRKYLSKKFNLLTKIEEPTDRNSIPILQKIR